MANLKLCSDLRPIHDFENAHGNHVSNIVAPAGTKCDYAVVFAEPLAFISSPASVNLPDCVVYWECRDPHYDVEAGYFCNKHRHSIAGPLLD